MDEIRNFPKINMKLRKFLILKSSYDRILI